MIYLKNLLLVLLILCAKFSLTAQVKLPALVSDNMVLQQNAKVNLWGWASPNEKINIQLGWSDTQIETVANA
ncbi:9-O-acetylesterase, partial [Flavobacterium sp. LBUM151]